MLDETEQLFLYLEYQEEEFEIPSEDIEEDLSEENEIGVEVITSMMPVMLYRSTLENEDTLKIPVNKDTFEAKKATIVVIVYKENKEDIKVVIPKAFISRKEAKEWSLNLEYKNICDIENPEWENKNILNVLVFTIDIED